MTEQTLEIRTAEADDLTPVNELIERAVATWRLPERVKRLALSSYRYTLLDLQSLQLVCARRDRRIIGVAAWEDDATGRSLHGLYVDPECWGQGVGAALLAHVERCARRSGHARLRVRAQADARDFFLRHGFRPVSGGDGSDYAHTLSKSLA